MFGWFSIYNLLCFHFSIYFHDIVIIVSNIYFITSNKLISNIELNIAEYKTQTLQKPENPLEQGREDCMRKKGWRAPGEHGPPNQLNSCHTGSQTLKWQTVGLHGCVPCPLLIGYGCLLGVFVVLINNGMVVSLTLICSLDSVLLLSCLVQLYMRVSALSCVSCFGLFGFCLLEPYSPKSKRGSRDGGKGRQEWLIGGETLFGT